MMPKLPTPRVFPQVLLHLVYSLATQDRKQNELQLISVSLK